MLIERFRPSPIRAADPAEFGRRLKRMRIQAGFASASAAAERAGIQQKTWSRWENGEHVPGAELGIVAGLLSCSVDYLLGLVDEPSGVAKGWVLVDAATLSLALQATRKEEVESLSWPMKEVVPVMFPVPARNVLMTHAEAKEQEAKLRKHLRQLGL